MPAPAPAASSANPRRIPCTSRLVQREPTMRMRASETMRGPPGSPATVMRTCFTKRHVPSDAPFTGVPERSGIR